MEPLDIALQAVIALGILNVWIVRFGRPSAWRGGGAADMKEEFAVYGLSPTVMMSVGAAKILCAAALVAGIWIPALVPPAAAVLGVLMLGAVVMHMKVGDRPARALPAASLLLACLLLAT